MQLATHRQPSLQTPPSRAIFRSSRHPQRRISLLHPIKASAEPIPATPSSTTDAATTSASHAANGNGATATLEQQQQQPSTSSQSSEVRGARVTVQNIVKHFHTRRGLFKAVNGVSLSMEPGTITALLGPSGSGKTTLLRLISGLDEATSGNVLFDGVDVTNISVKNRDIGILFQGYALFKHMNVADNIGFGPRIRKTPIDIDAKVEELLQLTELTDFRDRFPSQLSGGQKQRVALARALACDPKVLLLDEPFGALDPIVRKSVRRGLAEIVRKLGLTTIMVTHDQEEAWDMADNVVILHQGKIQQEGTPSEIAAAPANPFVMNFVSDVAHLPSSCQFIRKMGLATDKPLVMMRPSELLLYKNFTDQPYCCPATIVDKYNVGRAMRYHIKFDDDIEVEWYVNRQLDASTYDLDVGQRVFLKSDPVRMMPFGPEDIEWASNDTL